MDHPVTQAHLTAAVKEIIGHFNQSQGTQDQRFDTIDAKLEDVADDVAKTKLAVLDYLATDRAVHNLVRELKAQGISLDEKKIFAV